MNEIERAIEFMFGQQALAEKAYLKNTDERVIARIDKVVAYYNLAIKALRAELSRQENAPLTCEGCKWQEHKFHLECNDCIRYKVATDRYEPKGEKPCLK